MQDMNDRIKNLWSKVETEFIDLGQLLSEAKADKLHLKKGYNAFKEFVETEFGISGSMANKLIKTYDLYFKELDLDEATVKDIGFDKLQLISSLIGKASLEEQEAWIEKAQTMNIGELKALIKAEKDQKADSGKSLKDVFVDQFIERAATEFNCSRKELNFKLALYFQGADYDDLRKQIKAKQRQFEQQIAEE